MLDSQLPVRVLLCCESKGDIVTKLHWSSTPVCHQQTPFRTLISLSGPLKCNQQPPPPPPQTCDVTQLSLM